MKTRLILALAAVTLPACVSAQQSAASASTSPGGRSSATVTVGFGHEARINGLALRPLAIVEDSRCPRTANCVWAGRLRIAMRFGGQSVVLEPGTPVAIHGGRLTLVSANAPARAGARLPPHHYRLLVRFERP